MMKTERPKRGGVFFLLRTGDVRTLLERYSDIALAGFVALVVGVMIVPLPACLLDLLISFNIAGAISLLLLVIYVSDTLKIASFPTLVLLTTLFRLAIEVSATRLILVQANAGEVIHAFGNFVVAGNLVVGAVVFLILTIIQFVVIAKGSERVAEVGARFALDAMPGKQMFLDAELRAGHLDANEARRQRALLNRETQFLGAMDGAMKFVKGDAIAGIAVLVVNIVGGLVIGVVQKGMELAQAAHTYATLTIGEGLVVQIPALVISTAAGILVTRVSSQEEDSHLGIDMGRQVLAQPKALGAASALLVALALVPGLPTLPFLALGILLGILAHRLAKTGNRVPRERPGQDTFLAADHGAWTSQSEAQSAIALPMLQPIVIEISTVLARNLAANAKLNWMLSALLPGLRESYFAETGIPLPAMCIQERQGEGDFGEGSYELRLQEVTMARGEVRMDEALAHIPAEQLSALQILSKPAVHPDGSHAAWIAAADWDKARARGIPLQDSAEIIISHLREILRRHGHSFVGIQETQTLLDSLERSHPALVHEVSPKIVSVAQLADLLRRLAEERISLRNLREILGALAEREPGVKDALALTEHVRSSLRRQITFQYSNRDGEIGVFLLDSILEDTVREAIQETAKGRVLALPPDLSRDIVEATGRVISGNTKPVVLTQADIRYHLRRLLETEHPHVTVLSYQELVPEAKLQHLGRIAL